ncbi:aldo/keto reductase [Actinomadura rudentiformis]|uniref:Aldo/keto reductase n=1 Tax=Actinomadura rudentiformis TaxID=359158 RepID=A0A6H9YIK5_9ACTN|nr:aldo/keto reductase [Actinomadura rudentiformis]KAB2345905.1 aldo/keto reductase [Actinomadura rudentiformis]
MGAVNVPMTMLNTGVAMPRLGLGTWMMTAADVASVIPTAARLGYRMIDTAAYYENENGVGEGIARSGVPREEFFIISKVNGRDHGYDNTLKAFDKSLARLALDHLDLYLIHWPMPMRDRYVETWRAFARLLAEGRTRAIGVSNFTPAHIDRIIAEVGTPPAVNQIQLNPRVARHAWRAYAREHGITLQSWQPLNRGESLLVEPVVREIAARHRRTPAQIILRWHLQHDLVPLPKSLNEQRLAANIDVFDFQLSAAEIEGISALDGTEEPADPETTEVD